MTGEELRGKGYSIIHMKNKQVEHPVLPMKLWVLMKQAIRFYRKGLFRIKINIGPM